MSNIPISKTKIIPPRPRAELFSRRRLLDLLFDALDKKLILVSAPAGYGKTSLLVDLAHQGETPCCWLALDELDREPQRFAAYFIAALMERFPNVGAQARSLLEGMNSFEEEFEALTVTLVNELFEHVREHFVFVLDDFHLMDEVEPIQAFVNRFVQLMDENCHLVISSRTLTGLTDLYLLIARGQAAGLDYYELAFRRDELQALLAQNEGIQVSDEDAERLIAETEGWITGLQFSNSTLLQAASKYPVLEAGRGAGLFEYLGEQVLDRQSPELREFVLRTSLLEEFDASLCQSVLASMYEEEQDWQGWIKTIARNNLFALPVGEDGRWLRYHHLFRDFIRERFASERPAEVSPILERMQAAYEEMGDWVRAHQACKSLGDATALAALIERAGTTMMQSAHLTLESWLNELPPSLLTTRPGLLSIRGAIAHLKGNPQEALRLMTEAEHGFRNAKDIHGLTLTLVRQATVNRFLGNYADSMKNSQEVIDMTQASDELQDFHADALRVKGLALHRLGKVREAADCLQRSLTIYTRLNAQSQIPVLSMESGMAYRALGDFEAARMGYERALKIWREHGNFFWQAIVLNNLGFLHQILGEYEQAALAFEEGLLCARRSRHSRYEALVSISLGDLYAELGDIEPAQQHYRRAEAILKEMADRFLTDSLVFSQASLALLQRDAPLARTILDRVEGSALGGGLNYDRSLYHLIRGRLYLLESNPSEALKDLQNAAALLVEDNRNVEAQAASVWLAAAHESVGDHEKALRVLAEVSSNKNRVVHSAFPAMLQAAEWLDKIKNKKKLSPAVRDLFSQAGRLEEKIPGIRRQLRRVMRSAPPSAPHLAIQGFGEASVSVDGRTLTKSDWQTQSVRELFFYLLAASKALTREQIGDALWRDEHETSKMNLRFKNDMYRLRRAVGPDVVLFKDERYSFNRALDYEYDVEDFEAFLARAKTSQDSNEQIDYLRRALDLANGPCFNDLYADWTSPERIRLGQAHLDALLKLAGLYLQQARLKDCVAACDRAITIEPGSEPAYQISMQAYGRLGDRAAVKRTYEACRESMQSLFNLPPSKETKELYQSLMK